MAARVVPTGPRSYKNSRQNAQLKAFLEGKRQVASSIDGQHFLESVCSQEEASAVVERLIISTQGLEAIARAVRCDLSLEYVQTYAARFVLHISAPAVKMLNSGLFLDKILQRVVEPPTFVIELLGFYKEGKLNDEGIEALAWLSLELISSSTLPTDDVKPEIRASINNGALQKSENPNIRAYGYKIEKRCRLLVSSGSTDVPGGPGGRHDNDFEDFRKISVYPTRDELLYTAMPYYRLAAEIVEVPIKDRPRAHLDNQFRLLREDMLDVLKHDIQVATGVKKWGRKQPLVLGGLKLVHIHLRTSFNPSARVSLIVACTTGLEKLTTMPIAERKKFLKGQYGFLKHQSFGAFCKKKEPFAFGFVWRDEDKLAAARPLVEIQISHTEALGEVVKGLASREPIDFISVDTPMFAYEPVLEQLKDIKELPLEESLLDVAAATSTDFKPKKDVSALIERLKHGGDCIGSHSVDKAQLDSLIAAFSQAVSLIQGPPGTGKSYVGALFVKFAVRANMRVLLLSFTNHALDQFLEDLISLGLPEHAMVRLGSKSKEETASLSLHKQGGIGKRTYAQRAAREELESYIQGLSEKLKSIESVDYPSHASLLNYLQWEEPDAYQALSFDAKTSDGFSAATGKKNKADPGHLLKKWLKGNPPGPFWDRSQGKKGEYWQLPVDERQKLYNKWQKNIIDGQLAEIVELGTEFSKARSSLENLYVQGNIAVIEAKQIVACTTTAAAKYPEYIKAANPDVVVVEEAGEILEAHVLTALSPGVKQLVLIGDHKQLRPKINKYDLSVEKGTGYNLNMSLFERLILSGHPHTVLKKQHRMHPEISAFPRMLTYPDLEDGAKTKDRSPPRGLQSRVIFVDHEKPEQNYKDLSDRRDMGSTTSRQNTFEAKMVLKLVKYLVQQRYNTNQIAVLTPYLAQLRLLRELLSKDNDPVLADPDSAELRKAGLLTEAAAKVGKGKIRLSTIDNYQGEESDVIIISLTRSNTRGDIGFLSATERLNVLLTRSREVLIIIGHMDTFLESKKGGAHWQKFFNKLKENDQLHDGVPIVCQNHPATRSLLRCPEDFDVKCPDGGCSEPWLTLYDGSGAILNCGNHQCDRKCHVLLDHSNVVCRFPVERTCNKGHKYKDTCGSKTACRPCAKAKEDIVRRAKRDQKLEEERRAKQAVYERELDKVKDEPDHEKRLMKYRAEDKSRQDSLKKYKEAVEQARRANENEERKKEREAKAKIAKESEQSCAQNGDTQDGEEDVVFPPTNANQEWAYMKKVEGQSSPPLDALMKMIGLESVKETFLGTKSRVDTVLRQEISLGEERFSCSLLGNPGTGKTTVARIYAQFLTSVGVLPGAKFEETTGSKLSSGGVQGCQTLLDDIQNDGGGVLFIDEAYQLTSGNNPGGKGVLDYLLAEVENLTGKVVFVLAGYTKQMESFFAHNPGLPSRFPIEMKFEDYTDDELLKILKLKINNKFGGRMRAEEGLDGLFCRIVSRRIGHGRGRDGFGNAREVENALSRICNRQADRLRKQRRSGKAPDDLLLTKEDLIGPEPGNALANSKAWKKLNSLIGLQSVKDSVKSLLDTAQSNYHRELKEEPPIDYSLNKVFLGSPGTGKTTVAKLYGQILVDLGLLSNGEVVVKNPSDFVGGHLGQSEQQTKGILAATRGKVLVIDEAYGLYGGAGKSSSGLSDPYRTAAIDTIVAEVQSTPGEDRCVLLLGYKDQMEAMFQNVNPGLSRRFPLSSAFMFEDFSKDELSKILDLKLTGAGFKATTEGKEVALEVLERARNRPNFGNGGEVDILLDHAKQSHQTRVSHGKVREHNLLEAIDFDAKFDRAERSDTNIRTLFKDSVGCDRLISVLEGYQSQVRTMRKHKLDPRDAVPFNFLFRGPPGTGKTTTARKMGQVYYDMGFLATTEVVECSATDLIGEYVGQTGPKVQATLDKGLGRVLFIDEAYRLAEGHFAKEAVDELVDCVTKTKYMAKMVIILAGYDNDINRLLSVNPGLSSRFPAVVPFYSLTAEECLTLLKKMLQQKKTEVENRSPGSTIDLSALVDMRLELRSRLLSILNGLAALDSWGNARDINTLKENMIGRVFAKDTDKLVLTEETLTDELSAMYTERLNRESSTLTTRHLPHHPAALQPRTQLCDRAPQAPSFSTSSSTTAAKPEPAATSKENAAPAAAPPAPSDSANAGRDPGVTDEVWAQLELDKQAARAREAHYQSLVQKTQDADDADDDEELRQKILDELFEEKKRREEEQKKLEKLKAIGVCPVGFNWVRQGGGYRCTGGSHFMADGAF
ncbi:hypothetical protein jhhlp_004012 [Lomentospora prolificans]|uniref:AAA+ ATPase domain-containing protein n=1 Tax=Lomentospora prolificans TaxID=41688 RepID=A0A2N3NAH1_9PEZI|nr:hypothetical protein jhhlp_004012 [Lomentospora prolificans]